MLSDRNCQLLTSYVDGELDARQRVAVEHLVRQSSEARAFLEKLTSDSKELRELPRHGAPETLPDLVMQAITEQMPRTAPAKPRPLLAVAAPSAPAAIPAWLGLALAFSILLMVGAGTFFLAGGLLERPQVVDNKDRQDPQKIAPQNDGQALAPVAAVPDTVVDGLLGHAAENFGAPVGKDGLGIRVAFKDLAADEEPAKKRLTAALKKDVGVWLDVPVANNLQAVERFKEVFQLNGIRVEVDRTAQFDLGTLANPKGGQKGKKYLLYAENLRPDELTVILQQVAKSDAAAKIVDRIVLKSMDDEDRKDLAGAMRVAVKDVTPGTGGAMKDLPPFVDVGPITQNGKPKPGPERIAVLLPFSGGNQAISPEFKRFLGSRQALRPGTLQIVLVIHETAA